MEISGRVIAVTPIDRGTSKAGTPWQKCGFAIETPGAYPKKIYFTLLNERTAQCPAVYEDVVVHYDAESREYNGKWYTDLRAWKVDRPHEMGLQGTLAPQEPAFIQQAPKADDVQPASDPFAALPF